ncbi:glycosyltransferase family 39 protein [Candidatus Woesearchaeota archaeon]|nr:glycosyltransferase family 39 protein [Candidatus Woesearchaeota archaeon]
MKLNKSWLETLIFIALYLSAIYIWTQPLQKNRLPYGEYDAISHVEVADYMAVNDKSLVNLPHYIDFRYGTDNIYKPHTLWYYPPFHTAFAVIQAVAGERIVPIYILNAVFSTAIIISVYFVINSLFGFLPALLSALFLVFSPLDFLPFLWGQWPERLAYAYVPLILYCFYRYYTSYADGKEKTVYLYLTAILFGINLYMHQLAAFHSLLGIAVLFVFLLIKERKAPFNFKHILLCALIIIVMLAIFPYQTGNTFARFGVKGEEAKKGFGLSRLVHWAPNPKDFTGSVPESYFSFGEMHGLWTLPFLLLGIAVLAFRRQGNDLLMLAWLVSLYLVLHRDIIGKAAFLHRSLSASAHIFAPITAIGALSLASFIKSKYKDYIKYGIFIVIAVLIISINGKSAETLKNAYAGLGRITPSQYEASEWARANIPPTSNVSVVGVPEPLYRHLPWMAVFSQRLNRFFENLPTAQDYLMVDYTDLILLNDRAGIEKLRQFESNELKKYTLLYDKNNIRIYRLK